MKIIEVPSRWSTFTEKFGNKTASLLSCFPNLSASNIGGWAPFAFVRKLFLKCQQNLCHNFSFLQVMQIHLVASCSMTFSWFSRVIPVDGKVIGLNIFKKLFLFVRRVSVEEWISVYSIFCQSTFETTLLLDAVFIGFLWHKVVKGQRDCRSINSLSNVNQKFHICFHSHLDANVWKTIRTAVNLEYAPGPVHLQFGSSSKLKYFRIATNLTHDIYSENIRMPWVLFWWKWNWCVFWHTGEQETTLAHTWSSQSHSLFFCKLLRWCISQLTSGVKCVPYLVSNVVGYLYI